MNTRTQNMLKSDFTAKCSIEKRIEKVSFPNLENVDLYLVNLKDIQAAEVENAKKLLSQEEIDQCERFRAQDKQESALITQEALRHLIGNRTILRDSYGKPYLDGNPFYFNVSHTQDYAFIGISQAPIGVDIEKILEERVLSNTPLMSESEHQAIKDAPDKADAFFSFWCAKEALLKARGTGFQTRSVPTLVPGSGIFHSDDDQIHVVTRGEVKLAVCCR